MYVVLSLGRMLENQLVILKPNNGKETSINLEFPI